MTQQLSETAAAYLEGRNLDVELAVRMGLFSESAGGGGEILVFPFYRDGAPINHKRRLLPKVRMWQDTGAAKAAWNEDCLRDDSLLHLPLVITEGEFDALAAIQCGHLRTISVPDGAPPPAKDGGAARADLEGAPKYAWLQAIQPLLHKDRVREIIIASDGDENGNQLRQDLSVQLGRTRCKFLIYPLAKDSKARGRERLKDLNEVLEDHGPRGVAKTIGGAKFLKTEGLFRMSELPEPPPTVVWDLAQEFALLAENMKFRPGDVSVGTGIPSYGKTTFVNALWCALIERYGLTVAWASFEQRPKPDQRRNLRNWFLRSIDAPTADQLQAADDWIERHHLFISPPEDTDASLDWLLSVAEAAVIQGGAQVIVIDPWNELEHVRDRGVSLTEYVSSSLREVRRFAKAFNVHVQILAHPTKAVQTDDGSYRRPRMYDISDSSAWYNKCDLGFVVHRPNKDETQIVVEKSRYHEVIGVPGEVFMHFEHQTRHFKELGRSSMDGASA